MKTVSFEYLLPEYARALIYENETKKKHPLKKTLEMEIEKRLNLALDRQTYRVTQSRAAETFNGTIPSKIWNDDSKKFPPTFVLTLGLSDGSREHAKFTDEQINRILNLFKFLVGWSDIDYVVLAHKHQNLIFNALEDMKDTTPGTDARKRAEVRLQYAAENYGRWLEKVMY